MGTVQLIYIGGFGRSGSTLLEALLAKSSGVVACGEVVEGLSKWDPDRLCSCGKRAEACSLWGALPGETLKRGNWRHKDLDVALMQIIAPHAPVMTDSSKTAWKTALAPFQLWRAFGESLSLVHLVRDPRAVCWSVIKRERKRAKRTGRPARTLRRTLSCSLGWVTANLACELFGLFHPNHYMRVRYEDLTAQPRETVRTILHRLTTEIDIELEDTEPAFNRHQLFGNRARLVPLNFEDVRFDASWDGNIPDSSRRITEILCDWLHRRYEASAKHRGAKV